jgi:hypothetical protein
VQQRIDCTNRACDACPVGDADALTTCTEAAAKGACADETAATLRECPGADYVLETCTNLFGVIQDLCAGGPRH